MTLRRALTHEFKASVLVVRMEDLKFGEQVAVLSRCRAAVGMHGSILVMSLFLPEGALLAELFPFAVPAEHYTPYRTMAALPALRLGYLAWEARDPWRSIGHPERSPAEGGLMHLTADERARVLSSTRVLPHVCCSDPAWLYRIYQDTEVDVDVRALGSDRKAVSEVATAAAGWVSKSFLTRTLPIRSLSTK